MRAALLNGRKWLLLLFLISPAAILDILKSVPPAQIGTGFDGTKVHIIPGWLWNHIDADAGEDWSESDNLMLMQKMLILMLTADCAEPGRVEAATEEAE